MKLFGFNTSAPTPTPSNKGVQAFSMFKNVGGGNLSLPYIDVRYQMNGVIAFGEDNLYPDLIEQIYYTSAIHSSIVNFQVNAAVGAGFSFSEVNDAKDQLKQYDFKYKFKLDKNIRRIAEDLKKHQRVYFLLKFNDKKEVIASRMINPKHIRHGKPDEYGRITKATYCEDWQYQSNMRVYDVYHPSCEALEQLFMWQNTDEVYAIPSYTTAMNWMFLDGEMSYLQKANIQNSIYPAYALLFPFTPKSKEELENIKTSIEKNRGAQNASKAFVYFANDKDQLPQIQSLPTGNNDKLFLQTSKEVKENISFAHSINPAILGVKYAGSLGNAQELEMSYAVWEKNVVKPFRREIEMIVDELMHIDKVKGDFLVNEYRLIEPTVQTQGEV